MSFFFLALFFSTYFKLLKFGVNDLCNNYCSYFIHIGFCRCRINFVAGLIFLVFMLWRKKKRIFIMELYGFSGDKVSCSFHIPTNGRVACARLHINFYVESQLAIFSPVTVFLDPILLMGENDTKIIIKLLIYLSVFPSKCKL